MRTTAKPVIEALRIHILEYFAEPAEYENEHNPRYNNSGDVIQWTPIEELVKQIDYMRYNERTVYQTALDWVEGGSALIYHGDVNEFLDSLDINTTGKVYDDDKSWRLYCHLVAREMAKLYSSEKAGK